MRQLEDIDYTALAQAERVELLASRIAGGKRPSVDHSRLADEDRETLALFDLVGEMRRQFGHRCIGSFADRDAWRASMDYFLFRKGVRERLGSENGYVYFADGFPDGYEPSE